MEQISTNDVEMIDIPGITSERPPIPVDILDVAALPPKNAKYEPIQPWTSGVSQLGVRATRGEVSL